MLISLNKNIAVLAMTKTGSTSIEAALAPHCDIILTGDPKVKHIQLRRFERFFRPYLSSLGYDDVKTTCLFRDPLDWIGSWYRYRSRPAIDGRPNSAAKVTFEEFVLEYISDAPQPFAKIGRQSRFVTNKDGSVGVDYLYRYDRFEAFENFLSDRFRKPFSFDRLNVSPKIELELSHATRARFEASLARDYEIFESL